MDIVLERILSLIPKKPDGSFVHGARKEFAQSIGLRSGNVIADWISGRSESYAGYLYQISSVYNVSIEWLKGETDEKTKKAAPADGNGVIDIDAFVDGIEDPQLLLNLIAKATEKLQGR